jgi:hypothetical protein
MFAEQNYDTFSILNYIQFSIEKRCKVKVPISSRNNNKLNSLCLFWKKAEGWCWRNVTTLNFIDRAMN